MKLLQHLIPPIAKANLRTQINELHRTSQEFPSSHAHTHLTPQQTTLWNTSCTAAANLLHQLLIRSADKNINWGLHRHRTRITPQRLTAIYWWMLLYQLTLFRNSRIQGYNIPQDFHTLHQTAQRLIAHISPTHPGTWHPSWHTQVSLEAAIGIYNHTMQLLQIPINPETRILRVSLFTTATQRTFQTTAQTHLIPTNTTP